MRIASRNQRVATPLDGSSPRPESHAERNPKAKQVVADLVKHHVITLKSVVDAQAAKDEAGAYTAMRAAAGHMQMIADPLAVAIVEQFPDRFTASAK